MGDFKVATGENAFEIVCCQSTSLKYLHGETLKRFKAKTCRPKKRRYVYEDTYNEIMQWGEVAVKSGIIPRPKNNKPQNFPYYLSQFLLFKKR